MIRGTSSFGGTSPPQFHHARLTRCLAVIYLKNRITRGWQKQDQYPNEVLLSEEEKARFRDRLLPVLGQCHGLVRQQLLPILQRILHYDFPDNWPTFLGFTIQLLNTNEPNSVLAGLQCLLAICRAYRFKASEGDNRAHFDKIIETSFPRLLIICNELVNQESEEAGEMLHFALKAYKHATWVRTFSRISPARVFHGLTQNTPARPFSFPPPAADQHWLVHNLPPDRFQGNSGRRHAGGPP